MKFAVFILLAIATIAPRYILATPVTAVVTNSYDGIEKQLKEYAIDFDLISIGELEKKDSLKPYRAVFFPCGMQIPLHSRIQLLSQKQTILSVEIKEDINEENKAAIAENIRGFVENGGSAYFSDFAFSYLQESFAPFEFHGGFAWVGMPCRVDAALHGDLACFMSTASTQIAFHHSGWAAPEKINNASILCSGVYASALGQLEGPLTAELYRGSGRVIFTSFHSSCNAELKRFFVFRTVYSRLLDAIAERPHKWEQRINGTVVDALQPWESSRTYRLPVRKGRNTIYAETGGFPIQLDILDMNMMPIISEDIYSGTKSLDLDSSGDTFCHVRIIPSAGERRAPYTIASATGRRLLPRVTMIILISSVGALILMGIGLAAMKEKKKFGRLGRRDYF